MKYIKLYENFLSNIKASVVLVENIEGDLLLLKRGIKSRQQGWCLPGGGIDKGESDLKTAVRELYEETGIKVKKRDLVHIGIALSVKGFYVSIYYIKLNKEVNVKISEEHSEYKWTSNFDSLDLAGNTGQYIKMIK